MSMTITQAGAVNVIADHLTGTSRHDRPRPTRRQALEALQLLVPHAYKALGAGWTPAELQAHIGYDDPAVAR